MNLPELTWVEPGEVQIPLELGQSLAEHPLVLNALVRRGITERLQAQAFLHPEHYQLADPLNLPDLDRAVSRLMAAVHNGEKIAIWGDFDVDGQTATALLVQTLRLLGATPLYYIPVRSRESHGVNLAGLNRLINSGAQLILTCDTGITAHAEVEAAKQSGVEMLITDHHTLPEELPDAAAVINPQRLPAEHPLHPLCGVGVAFQLAKELLNRFGRADEAEQLLDLVALGTIADLSSLTGDNRCLVQTGLRLLRAAPRPALRAILSLAAVNPGNLNEEHLSFIIAPRLNALGRLSDANGAVPFLLATDEAEVIPTAQELDKLNTRRKLLCDQVFEAALAQIKRESSLQESDILVLEHAQWPAGVIGIAASRLVELFKRPVILISSDPAGIGRASARSVEGINITHALAAHQDLLTGFGGHAMAAGFSLPGENIPRFRRAINRTIQQMKKEHPPIFELAIDAYISLNQIDMELVGSIDHLAPFGPGNPPIVLATRDLTIKSRTTIGKTKEHVQVIVEDISSATRKILRWQGGGLPLPEGRFDLAYSVRAANYRGQVSPQIEWIAARRTDETIEIQITSQVEAIDHRQSAEPLKHLAELAAQPDTLIWREGENNPAVLGADRNNLTQAEKLILWNIPPSRDELTAILHAVKPKVVYLFAVSAASDEPLAFLTRLSGLVRFVLNKQQGKTSLRTLAAAACQREATVQKGLAWLAAKGHLRVEKLEDTTLLLQSNGQVDTSSIQQVELELHHLLTETGAYRAYFKRADAAHLLED